MKDVLIETGKYEYPPNYPINLGFIRDKTQLDRSMANGT